MTKKMKFQCSECGFRYTFDPDQEDPTTSTGACPVCGSHKYILRVEGELQQQG
jgi:DNA-directed RNA polymerase subunit RPC12/RpoP